MAINIPIITSLEDTGIKSAKAAFNDFKTAVGKAEGGMGKFKAGSKVALDAVKANAGTLAIAGAAAFGTFAKTAITAFQDIALASGKFADATGLSVEDASRYLEVAGDLSIPVDAVEGVSWSVVGMDHRESLGLGAVLNGRGVMELVVAGIAYQNGFIGPTMFSTLVLMGIVTTFLTPIFFKQVYRGNKLEEYRQDSRS